jgi:hypothetical protein
MLEIGPVATELEAWNFLYGKQIPYKMQFMVERNVRGECDYRNLQQLVFYYFIL